MDQNTPNIFKFLLSDKCVEESDVQTTADGFCVLNKSVSDILMTKRILDFSDASGDKFRCDRFFDDWFLYAVADGDDYVYSLLKLREQEYDAADGSPADGDTPGVTISFIAFDCETLLACLVDSSDANRRKLNDEINRVVAYRGQRHHTALKRYFQNPHSQGAYLVSDIYIRKIAAFVEDGYLRVPSAYREIVQQSISYKYSAKLARLPRFIEWLNDNARELICDHEKIAVKNPHDLSEFERLAILATHTGNTSVYSFAAEVEYHAKFLTPLAKIKLPFFGRSIYDSAIRADMTVGDTKFKGPVPFYSSDSQIVKRQYTLHKSETQVVIEREEQHD